MTTTDKSLGLNIVIPDKSVAKKRSIPPSKKRKRHASKEQIQSAKKRPLRDEEKGPRDALKREQSTLDDQKAEYIATFHARPRDLDRRSGAFKKKIVSSKDSTHVFTDTSTWTDLRLHSRLQNALETMKLHRPTNIQVQTMATFDRVSDESFILQAETGSGKTLAYFLPILQSLALKSGKVDHRDRTQAGTRCLILCPTRELGVQTLALVEKLCEKAFNWIIAGSLFGEEKRKSEKARIRKGLNIIVATPGRLLDHLIRTDALLMALKGKVEWIVLDEADRLLDMGQGDQVKQIIERIRANQSGSGHDGITWRSFLVSATVNDDIKNLAKNCLLGIENSWITVKADSVSTETKLAESTPKQLVHFHMLVTAKLRLIALISFLVERHQKKERAIVFLGTCASVDFVHALLQSMKSILGDDGDGFLGTSFPIFKLHGSIARKERHSQLKNFGDSALTKEGAVLLATDVAARGLNLPDCEWTVQYDPPSEVSDYIHRAGRVARAGKAGHSLLFVLPSETEFLDVLEERGLQRLKPVSLNDTLAVAAKASTDTTKDGLKKFGKSQNITDDDVVGRNQKVEAFCVELQSKIETIVTESEPKGKKTKSKDSSLLSLARQAYLSHLRAYPTKEKAIRKIFTTRALHLGHIARSFGLREPPTQIKSIGSKNGKSIEKEAKASNMSFSDFIEIDKPESTPNPKIARNMLLANASKLTGMGAF